MNTEEPVMPDNHLGQSIEIADANARLDENAKELLADKSILAELIQRLIPEFHNIPREEIKAYINGTPHVGRIRVHPGETNPSFQEAEAIRSLGQESKIPYEGLATFDVLFTLTLPDSEEVCVEVYVDIEAQNSENLSYHLETRAVYYLARLLSSQYQRDFSHSEYEKLRKVYSIWIVMDPSERSANTISSIAFQQTALLGDPEDNRGYDKAQAFIVRLQKHEEEESEDRLVSLLNTLFKSGISPEEKKTVLVRDFQIPVTEHIERAVANMCNYSDYVRNQGIQQGAEQNALSNIRSLMETTNWAAPQAMDALKIPKADQAKYAAILAGGIKQ